MGTNPIGKGTRNISVNVPEELRDRLKDLAEESGISMGAYIRAVLTDAVNSNANVVLNVSRSSQQEVTLVAETEDSTLEVPKKTKKARY